MAFHTLVETDALASHLGDADWVGVDCRAALNDLEWGPREYEAGHIPGAVHARLEHDLSGQTTGTNGRHPLPDPAALAATFGRWGIGPGVQVVAYDQGNGMFASRLWWLLRWVGHDAVAVLNGGFAKWTAEGRPTRSGAESRPARVFTPVHRRDAVVEAGEVARRVGDPEWVLLDVRAPERYRGDIEPIDRVAGHVPGAVNSFHGLSVDESGVFRSPEALRLTLGDVVGDRDPSRVVCYCGSGVTACQTLLALELAGLPGAKLYPGSWSEWSSDPDRPVERSANV